MKHKIIKLTAPSAWASYLIYGGSFGMEIDGEEEKAQADAWIARKALGFPVDCEDAGFLWSHDAFKECPLGADCQEYAFLIPNPVLNKR